MELRMSEDRGSIARGIWVILGTLALGIGLVGVVIPVLPTTPFLLAAAYCYSRGSKRFHVWLTTNRIVGRYIRDYQEGKGISSHAKMITLILLWSTILISALVFVHILWVQVVMIMIALAVSYHILSIGTGKKVKTMEREIERY